MQQPQQPQQQQQQRSRRLGPSTCLLLRPRSEAGNTAAAAAVAANPVPSATSLVGSNNFPHSQQSPESSATTPWPHDSSRGFGATDSTPFFADLQQRCAGPLTDSSMPPQEPSLFSLLAIRTCAAPRANSSPGFFSQPQDNSLPQHLPSPLDPNTPPSNSLSDMAGVSPFSIGKVIPLFCTPTLKEDEDLAKMLMSVDIQNSPTRSTAFPLRQQEQGYAAAAADADCGMMNTTPSPCHQPRARGQLHFPCAPPPPQQQQQHMYQSSGSPFDASFHPAPYPGSTLDTAAPQEAPAAAQAQRARPPSLLLRSLMAMNRSSSHGLDADAPPASWGVGSRGSHENNSFTTPQAPSSAPLLQQPFVMDLSDMVGMGVAQQQPGSGSSFLARRPGEKLAGSRSCRSLLRPGTPPELPTPRPAEEGRLTDDEAEQWEWQQGAKRRCRAAAPPRMAARISQTGLTR